MSRTRTALAKNHPSPRYQYRKARLPTVFKVNKKRWSSRTFHFRHVIMLREDALFTDCLEKPRGSSVWSLDISQDLTVQEIGSLRTDGSIHVVCFFIFIFYFAGSSLSVSPVSLVMKISQCFGSVMLLYCTIDSHCISFKKTCMLSTEKSLLIHTTHFSRKESTTELYPWVGECKEIPYCVPVHRWQARSPLHLAWLINKNTWDGEDISYASLLDQLQMFKTFFFENKSDISFWQKIKMFWNIIQQRLFLPDFPLDYFQ